jgi:rfaE bifunctional protein nucleotidyltransferase chain/domain
MSTLNGKIVRLNAITRIAAAARRNGKRVVTTNGCFDILHIGHVRNLTWARAQGDLLIVGLNADASVRAQKGPERPIVPARERAFVLAGLGAVDYVFVFSGKSPIPWLRRVRPAIHVKGRGSERSPAFEPEGRVVLAPYVPGRSTTNIIEKVLHRHRRTTRRR